MQYIGVARNVNELKDAIALAAQDQINEIKNAIADAFNSAQFAEPRFFTSLPSAGAQIVMKLDR